MHTDEAPGIPTLVDNLQGDRAAAKRANIPPHLERRVVVPSGHRAVELVAIPDGDPEALAIASAMDPESHGVGIGRHQEHLPQSPGVGIAPFTESGKAALAVHLEHPECRRPTVGVPAVEAGSQFRGQRTSVDSRVAYRLGFLRGDLTFDRLAGRAVVGVPEP